MTAPPDPRAPTLFWALFPIVATLLLLTLQVFVFEGSPHVPLIFGVAMTAVIGRCFGLRWEAMQEGMVHAVASAVPVIAIMLTVGMVIGTWILSGTVPLLAWLGLQLLTPAIFLPATCIVCALISVATGTSWGTVGTIGLALIGIGESMAIPMPLTAGAIVSGAWFGDKLSPLSDSTNFAAAIAGVGIYAHIRNLLPTTLPAVAVALVAYAVLGAAYADAAIDHGRMDSLMTVLQAQFHFGGAIGLLVLLPPLVVMAMVFTRMPALPGIFAGVLAAGAVAMLVQDATLGEVMAVMMNGHVATTGDALVDTLLTKGGLLSMLWVVLLIMVAMAFGGVLERTGCFDTLLRAIIPRLHTRFRLFAVCLLATFGINTSSNIYVALTVPGRMFAPVFRGMGYSATNLSRILEDGGTMTSPLIPWNPGGVFVSGTLGVPVLLYAPFAFANWLAILFDLLWSWLGVFTPRVGDAEFADWHRRGDSLFHDGRFVLAAELPGDFRSPAPQPGALTPAIR
ncbi:MAG TPA: Na+/H+ antiporter NhaC [Pseudomonadales bacterium]|nr:Na+/H+ antiporter NhaC [Pseudomonadales bacterium]